MAGSPSRPNRKPRRDAAAAKSSPGPLASLPLDVLDNILDRLHIYEVVRTSVLSRAWRRRWEVLPSVDLTNSPGVAASDVDALLLRRSAPVRAFRLVARDPTWFVDALHDWLLYLSRNGVQTLDLSFPQLRFQLHSSIFSCRDLTCLVLKFCRLPPAPSGFAGFPNLKRLELNGVELPQHGGRELAALIAASPLLEDVDLMAAKLIGDGPDEDWVIRAPNLRMLTMVCEVSHGGRAEDLPRLEEGILFGPNNAKLLSGMAGVTKLEFYSNCMLCTEVDVLEQLPFVFKNLKNLVLAVNFFKTSHMLSIFCLLRSAPVLEELDVWGWTEGCAEFEANDEFLNAQWADDMFSKLQIVRLKQIVCVPNEMYFMEFVLSKARVLRKLSVSFASGAICSNEEALIDITEYPRASPDAQVIFMGRESESAFNERRGIMNAPTEDSVAETQTSDSGLRDVIRPWRRHCLDLESAAQVEQLQEEMLELQLQMQQCLKARILERDSFASIIKDIYTRLGISLPECPESSSGQSSHPAPWKSGDTTVDPVTSGAGDAHVGSEEIRAVCDVANDNASV